MKYNIQNKRKYDKPGYPALPLRIILNERIFSNAFKRIMKLLITEKEMDNEFISYIENELKKQMVQGFERVDFDNAKNAKALQELVDDLWSKYVPMLRIVLRQHNRNFEKKSADKV